MMNTMNTMYTMNTEIEPFNECNEYHEYRARTLYQRNLQVTVWLGLSAPTLGQPPNETDDIVNEAHNLAL